MSDTYTPKWFKAYEFECPGECCSPTPSPFPALEMWQGIVQTTMMKLDDARDIAEVPFVINSAYRCVAHNKAVGGSNTSSHLLGYAFDIHVANSHTRFKILLGLLGAGFTRIGIYKNHIHVDDDPFKRAEVAWFDR